MYMYVFIYLHTTFFIPPVQIFFCCSLSLFLICSQRDIEYSVFVRSSKKTNTDEPTNKRVRPDIVWVTNRVSTRAKDEIPPPYCIVSHCVSTWVSHKLTSNANISKRI